MTKDVWHHNSLGYNKKGRTCKFHVAFQTAYVSSRYLMMSELSNIPTFWLGSCNGTVSAMEHVQQWGTLCTHDSNNKTLLPYIETTE